MTSADLYPAEEPRDKAVAKVRSFCEISVINRAKDEANDTLHRIFRARNTVGRVLRQRIKAEFNPPSSSANMRKKHRKPKGVQYF